MHSYFDKKLQIGEDLKLSTHSVLMWGGIMSGTRFEHLLTLLPLGFSENRETGGGHFDAGDIDAILGI